jgi:hypothetical protein
MFTSYWLEDRSAWFILLFAAACASSSAYGFLAGTLPFAIVEVLWTVVALLRFRKRRSIRSDLSDSAG